MGSSLITKRNAKKLITGGGVGLGVSVLLTFASLLSLYGKTSECPVDKSTCADSFGLEEVGTSLAYILAYVSLAVIIAGIVMIVMSRAMAGQQAVEKQAKPDKHPAIKFLIYAVAFFAGGSIITFIVVSLIPVLFSSSSVDEQARIFTYTILVLYPVVGSVFVYMANKWLKRK